MSNRIEIINMFMARASQYGEQWRRPYETVSSPGVLNEAANLYAQSGGRVDSVSGSLFAPVAGDFLRPSATPESRILVPHGWNAERFTFLMFLRVYHDLGFTTELVQGYTDIADLSLQTRKLNPQTYFVINSITTIATVREHGTLFGARDVSRVKESVNILANNQGFDISAFSDPHANNQNSMRPADIYSKIQTMNQMGGVEMVDFRTANVSLPKASRRINNVPTEYLGNVVKSWAGAMAKSMYDVSTPEVYSSAMANSIERGLNLNPFLKALAQLRTGGGGMVSNGFYWNEMCRLDPHLENDNTRCVLLNGAPPAPHAALNHQGITAGSENWVAQNRQTQAATLITGALPALMLQCGLRMAVFNVTNHTIGSQTVYNWAFAQAFDEPTTQQCTLHFEQAFVNEVLNGITHGNQIPFNIRISCDVLTSTALELQIDAQPMTPYTSPTFADALLTPVITTDPNRPTHLASDIDNLINTVVQASPVRLEDINTYEGSI